MTSAGDRDTLGPGLSAGGPAWVRSPARRDAPLYYVSGSGPSDNAGLSAPVELLQRTRGGRAGAADNSSPPDSRQERQDWAPVKSGAAATLTQTSNEFRTGASTSRTAAPDWPAPAGTDIRDESSVVDVTGNRPSCIRIEDGKAGDSGLPTGQRDRPALGMADQRRAHLGAALQLHSAIREAWCRRPL